MATMTAKFAGTCKACNGNIAAGDLIVWTRAIGATHLKPEQCLAAQHAAKLRAASNPAQVIGGAAAIAAFILAARDRGLKFPKARFLAPCVPSATPAEMRLSIAGERSKVPGSINVMIGGEWIGRIDATTGAVSRGIEAFDGLVATLAAIASNPAAAAKAYGALMCRCSFCNLALTDAGSVEAGYGPVCADKWGLPHVAKGTPVLSKVAA